MKKKSNERFVEYESDKDFEAIREYAAQNCISFRAGLRHQMLRQLLHRAGGRIPAVQELAAGITARGLPCTPDRIAEDLRSMGWPEARR